MDRPPSLYTWSKALSNGGGAVAASYGGENAGSNQDFFNVRADRALNHTNLSELRNSVNDSFFGQLLSTRGASVVQVNARLTF